MSTFVISDIHGCFSTFNKLLQTIKFSKKDTLYILGDMIDRGPDSAGVIQRILDLRSEGFKVKVCIGNHEVMMLESRHIYDSGMYSSRDQDLWIQNGGISSLKSYNIQPKDYENFWVNIPFTHREFFLSLPYYFNIKKHILVHAGLKFKPNRDDFIMELSYGLKPEPIKDPIKDTIDYDKVWIRDFAVIPEMIPNKILVTGHTPLPLFDSIWPMRDEAEKTKHIMIDGGCWYTEHKDKGYGNLVALRLNDHELFWEENCETN